MEVQSNSRNETRAFYDKISHVYDLLAEESEGPFKEQTVQRLGVRPGDWVLEIGCGTGRSLLDLAKAAGPNGHVFGVDLSTGMLTVAHSAIGAAGHSSIVSLMCSDATHLALATGVVDDIFMSFTLELFDEREVRLVLAECRRVLKPGGRVAVVAVSTEGPHGVAFELYEWTHRHFPKIVDCRPIAVREVLESSGFHGSDRRVGEMWGIPVEIVVAELPRS